MSWLRRQKDIPSYSGNCGVVATDIDFAIHRYMTAIDKSGTREVQSLMVTEVKTRGGDVNDSQRDSLIKIHAGTRSRYKFCGQTIRNYGVSFLFLTGLDPDDSQITWGRFEIDKKKWATQLIVRRPITKEQLKQLLRFELDPDTLRKMDLRRHHKERRFTEIVTTSLGFQIEQEIILRS
jgi:hypothetical protein